MELLETTTTTTTTQVVVRTVTVLQMRIVCKGSVKWRSVVFRVAVVREGNVVCRGGVELVHRGLARKIRIVRGGLEV